MAEPHSAALGGAAMAASVTITGTFLGAQADALVLGLLAATFVSAWLHEINSLGRAAAAVCLSALLAGYLSPVLSPMVSGKLAGLSDGDPLRLLLAVAIGATAPGVVPALLTRARSYASSEVGK